MKIKVGRALLFIFRPLIYLIFPHKFVGRENLRDANGGIVVCCNHISAIDPVFLLIGFRKPVYFMAKEEIFKNRLAAWFLRELFGVFIIKRGKSDTGGVQQAVDIVRDDRPLGIFPEGTRCKNGQLGRFHSGAAYIISQTGADVYPCAVFTKSGKVTPFHRATVVFGKRMSAQSLHLEDADRPDLRYASRKLSKTIQSLIDENR